MTSTKLCISLASLLTLGLTSCEASQPSHPPDAQPPASARGPAEDVPAASARQGRPAPSGSDTATSAEPVPIPPEHVFVRVTRMNGGLEAPTPGGRARPFRQVVVAIRRDGKAVWSEDAMGQGPLRSGTIAPERLEKWIADLRAAGTLTDPAMKNHFGPDARTIEIDIDLGNQKMKIASWHMFVDETKSIALSRGIVSLGGRSAADMLAEEPPEYRRFLDSWSALRKDIRDLLPQSGEPVPEGKSASDVLGRR